jgi:NAD+ kinase
MIVAIYGRPFKKNLASFIEKVFKTLTDIGADYIVYESYSQFLAQELHIETKHKTFRTHQEIRGKIDYLFSIGGDGTMLDTISLVRDSGIPVIGINTGRLGYLAGIRKEDIESALHDLALGHYSIDSRNLLHLETDNFIFGDVNYGLNELTIHKKDSSSMITINAYLNGEFLNSYWADGLIISTATGSTGYSLSCGGPIILPHSESFVITPIAPHNLNVRPVIVSDKNVISLEVEGRSQHFLATLDSRSVTIDSSIQLAVRKENFKLNLIRLNGENYLNTLRNKLMWGIDKRN